MDGHRCNAVCLEHRSQRLSVQLYPESKIARHTNSMSDHRCPKANATARRDAPQTSYETRWNPTRCRQPPLRLQDNPANDLAPNTFAWCRLASHRPDKKAGPRLCRVDLTGAIVCHHCLAVKSLVLSYRSGRSLCSYRHHIRSAKIAMASSTSASVLKK